MKPEQQRIAIAQACGLKVIDVPFIPSQTKAAGCVFTDAARTEWRKCYPNSCGVYGVPDYLNDLNAMHKAERVLSEKEQRDYCFRLLLALVDGSVTNDLNDHFIFLHATAAQRAEALLKTIGKWEETK